jgi:predicted DNA-binding protein
MLQRGWAIKHERNYRDNLNVRLPWGVKEELKKIAEQRNMSLSDLIRLSIERFLAETENKDTSYKG